MSRHRAPRPGAGGLRAAQILAVALVATCLAAAVQVAVNGSLVPVALGPVPAVSMPPATDSAAASSSLPDPRPWTLPEGNALTPELAAFLARLDRAGVAVDTTTDTAVLDTARRLCRDGADTTAVGKAFDLVPVQAAAARATIAAACPT